MVNEEILSHLDNPSELERLYRTDKAGFRRAFNAVYADLQDNKLVAFWSARLNFAGEGADARRGSGKELIYLIIACLLAGLIAKLPAFFFLDEEFFYSRNVGFIVFPLLSAFFAWKNHLSARKIAFIAGATLFGLIFINALPDVEKSDTLVLSCIHLVLFLWSLLGITFLGEKPDDEEKRLSFLRYNGDLLVITTLIVIAGMILSGVTVQLFSLIGFNIEQFYFQHIAVFALPSAPILGTYLIRSNPQLVGKVSPVIARIFSPLVLVMLVVYLTAMIYAGKDPYNDREFLIIFNALLIGVMAIIFFSVAGSSDTSTKRMEILILFLLSLVTVFVNGIALSAILFRIMEMGVTPNRMAVMGANVLILINLLLVTMQLYQVAFSKAPVSRVGKVIASYLPVYCLWVLVVTFLFPLIFGFK